MKPGIISVRKVLIYSGLIGIIAYLVIRSLIRNLERLQGETIPVDINTTAALILFTAAVPVTGALWGSVITRLSKHEVSSLEGARVHIASWLLKYIPGQVGSIAWKITWGTRMGIAKTAITISFLYENIFLAIASTAFTLPIIIGFLGPSSKGFKYVLIGLAIAAIFGILSARPVFYRLAKLIIKVTKRKVDLKKDMLLGAGEIINYQLAFLIPRIFNGVGFALITWSIVSISLTEAFYVGAVYVLAGIIGILAIFVPSGIGVREGVIVLLLSSIMPVELAIFAAVVGRLYATVADILLSLIYALTGPAKDIAQGSN